MLISNLPAIIGMLSFLLLLLILYERDARVRSKLIVVVVSVLVGLFMYVAMHAIVSQMP